MIDKSWRKRFKTLSDKLDKSTASAELNFALKKFRSLDSDQINPEIEHDVIIHTQDINVNEILDKTIEKGLDTATLLAAWLKK